ncbi:hypothetical protein [Streptomyces radicis]|uniref:hypothetical protein n=1 Tax=Streptomyces radicis TaxID=1750517 RepID=UPI001C7CA638|nr:hypothetical protein [Streptomyces radicis]
MDLVIGGYGTNALLPATPLMVERERFFVGLMGLGVNNALHCPSYFAMIPTGPDPNAALTEGYFALAAEQKPRPETVALVRDRPAEVVAQAVEATGGLDDASLSAYAREATFRTVMGDVRFGVRGEWSRPRVLQVHGQFRNYAEGLTEE